MERKGGEGKCASLSMERTVARIVEPKAADSKTAGVCHGFASSVLARLRPLLCVCVCVFKGCLLFRDPGYLQLEKRRP